MIRSILVRVALVSMVLPLELSAGKPLRVGPSRTYRTIQAAIDRASAGDLVLVDPGDYAGFQISGKGIAIVNSGANFVVLPDVARPSIDIRDVPAGQSVTVMGVKSTVAHGRFPVLRVVDCAGAVRVMNTHIEPTTDLIDTRMRAVIEVSNCSVVALHDLRVRPSAPRTSWSLQGTNAPGGADHGVAALLVADTNIHLVRCELRGYDNVGSAARNRWGGDAVRSIGQTVVRVEGFPTYFIGGAGGEFGGSAIHHIDPRVPWDVLAASVPFGAFVPGAGPKSGGQFGYNYDRGRHPSGSLRYVPGWLLNAAGETTVPSRVRINSNVAIEVRSVAPRDYAMFVGPTGFHKPMGTFLGYLDYHSPLTLLIRLGRLPPSSLATVNVAVPNLRDLIGYQFGAQAILGPVAGQGQAALSPTMSALSVIVP